MPLVRLVCAHCGGDLAAAPDAVLFACPECGHASALAGGRLVPTGSAVASPRHAAAPGGPGLYPCWFFPVIWTETAASRRGAAPAWVLPGTIAVPSLAPEHGGAYLRLARALSLLSPPVTAGSAPVQEARGGQLGPVEAARLIESVALACVPPALRHRLLDSDEPPLRAGPPALIWLPYARTAGRLRDLVCGVEVTARLLGSDAEPPSSVRARDGRAPAPRQETGAVCESEELAPLAPGPAR